MERLLALNENEELLLKITKQLPDKFINSGMNVPGPVLAKIHGSAIGLYSFLHQWMFFEAPSAPHMLKVEDFPATLKEILISFDCDVSPDMQNYLLNGAPANKSSHNHYSYYYSKEIADRVMGLDKSIINTYDYTYSSEC